MLKPLYEKDFQLWLQQTIKQLQQGDFEGLDVEHLIEELTELGKYDLSPNPSPARGGEKNC